MPSQTITLPSGQVLSYDDFGPAHGFPILFFHGTPASRINWRFFGDGPLLDELGARVLALDRPGIGRSSPQPRRSFISWAESMRELLDELEVEQASVLAHSGGGPYALACGIVMPERLLAAGLAASSFPDYRTEAAAETSPTTLQLLRLSAESPRAARLALGGMGLMARFTPGLLASQAVAALPPPDEEVLEEPGARGLFVMMVREALRQGPEGARQDAALMYGPWDLDLDRVRVPVRLWHGSDDRNVPVASSRLLHERLQDSTLQVIPGEGHISLLARHAREIVGAMVPHPG